MEARKMLVLSRRISESIEIGKDVTVTILGVNVSGRVQLGIAAPADQKILRTELQETAKKTQTKQTQI